MIENFDFYTPALKLGKLLRDFKGENVVVLDLRDKNIWTDFFVIATISSGKQASGFEGKILEAAKEMNIAAVFAVVNPEGNLIIEERMDNAILVSVEVAYKNVKISISTLNNVMYLFVFA